MDLLILVSIIRIQFFEILTEPQGLRESGIRRSRRSSSQGFVYGTEYTEEKINEALQRENPLEVVPSKDENSHGTFLASIAAGSENIENRFKGAAPEATLGIVKLKKPNNI